VEILSGLHLLELRLEQSLKPPGRSRAVWSLPDQTLTVLQPIKAWMIQEKGKDQFFIVDCG
jgi:hypothetical protein